MNTLTTTYFIIMFLSFYFFFFFIILIARNYGKFFLYPVLTKFYKVSVLIPAYNEGNTIGETIESVFNSNYPKKYLEVIAINDGSKDDTVKVVRKLMKKYNNLKLLNKENSGKADSLNQGIKIAKGDLIAVVDSDSFPEKDSIKKLIGYFDDPKMGAVTSAVFIKNKEKFLERIQVLEYMILAFTRKLLDFIGSVYVTNGPLSVYRKSILEEVGGFDIKTVTEDVDITWNILSKGYKSAMCLDATVYTTAPETIKILWRQRVRWGVGGIQALIKYKKDFLKKGMFGFFVMPFVSFSIFLSMAVFIFSTYILSKNLFQTYLSTKYSYMANTYLFSLNEVTLHMSVLIYFAVLLFLISFFFFTYILRIMTGGGKDWKDIKNLFNRLFYLLVFLGIYPIVWFVSFYRLMKGDFSW